jgi:hypothetical protein
MHFDVKIKPAKPQIIKEVIWSPPFANWVKCNSDGASLGNPGTAACGGVFRNSNSEFLGAFAINLGLLMLYVLSLLELWWPLRLHTRRIGATFG